MGQQHNIKGMGFAHLQGGLAFVRNGLHMTLHKTRFVMDVTEGVAGGRNESADGDGPQRNIVSGQDTGHHNA